MNRSATNDGSIEGLHYIRAAAAFAVLALHAMVPYVGRPMPGLAWPISDHRSSMIDGAFWGIELFIMPLFLLMAGYLAARSLDRGDAKSLWRSRLPRLAIPLLVATIVILPMELYLWVAGWVIEEVVPIRKLKSLKFDDSVGQHLWGTAHLWFLVYLLSYIGLLTIGGRMKSSRIVSGMKPFLRRSKMPLAIALMMSAGAVVAWRPEVVWGFQHATLPVPSKWVYCGICFLVGVLLFHADDGLRSIARRVRPISLATAAATAAAMWLGFRHLDRMDVSTPTGVTDRMATADIAGDFATSWLSLESAALGVFTAMAAIGIGVVLIGWSIRIDPIRRDAVRYLSAASLWIYLVHHPVVSLLHVDLQFWWPNGGGAIKSVVATTMAAGVSLFLYEVAVRDRVWAAKLRLIEPARRPGESMSVAGTISPDQKHAAMPARKAA